MTGRVVLLGEHIGYSASPAMHNAAFAACRLDLVYELADVSTDALASAIDAIRNQRGANVTRPHKVAAMALVDEFDTDAARAGALNTIVQHDGRLIGHNTDVPAISAELRRLVPGARSAVILGAGGASNAAALALSDAGVDVQVVRRDGWETLPTVLRDADVLVNATPIGTLSDVPPVDAGVLRPDLAVLDLVYRPSPTRLVGDARAAGGAAVDGAGVLLRQAALSFTLWTGIDAPLDAMRAALEVELARG